MLKTLTKDDTTTTPYLVTKNWNLSNIANEDLVLSEAGNPIVAENVDYLPTTIKVNDNCNVAKEKQELDLARYREGLKLSGLFYPDIDPLNIDGTYKRIVYAQIKTMFYNNFHDPTKIWGTEKLDFNTSQTKKFLSDSIKLFDIPTDIMGQKIVEGSVSIIDNTLDNDYIITDDKRCNLFAGTNLFSKQQEIGSYQNVFLSGSDSSCDSYFDVNYPNTPINLTGSQLTASQGIFLTWNTSSNETNRLGFGVEKSTDSGITFNFLSYTTNPLYTDVNVSYANIYEYRVFAYNTFGNSSYSNITNINTGNTYSTISLINAGTANVNGFYTKVDQNDWQGPNNYTMVFLSNTWFLYDIFAVSRYITTPTAFPFTWSTQLGNDPAPTGSYK